MTNRYTIEPGRRWQRKDGGTGRNFYVYDRETHEYKGTYGNREAAEARVKALNEPQADPLD